MRAQAWFSITFAVLVIATGAGPVLAQPAPPQGACQQIRAACERAGFKQGGAKEGMGLQVDCIRPIMQGTPQPRRAGAPLPQIDPQVVTACKAQKPNFGLGNAGQMSAPPSPAPQPAAPPPAATPPAGARP